MLVAICGEALRCRASDVHLQSGLPAVFFVEGQLRPGPFGPFSASECDDLVLGLLDPAARQRLQTAGQTACLYAPPAGGRFRVHAYRQRGALAARLRVIGPAPRLDQLGLPRVLEELAQRPSGLVLVAGVTGSGVTTTLAALVESINRNACKHIFCLEELCEYVHPELKSLITRGGWADVRQADANVVLISQLDGVQEVSRALRLASQGVLVLAGIAARDALAALDRMVGGFHCARQDEMRDRLSQVTEGVVAQQLVPGRVARVAAVEVLIGTPAVKNLIRESKQIQLYNVIQTGSRLGMQLMEQALFELIKTGKMTAENALAHCYHPDELRRMLEHSR